MSTEKTHTAKLILQRLKDAYNIKKDGDLADYLGVAQSTLSSWKNRNTIDYDLIFANCKDLRADYIIYGQEPKFRHSDDWIKEPNKPYTIPNQLESFRTRIKNMEAPLEVKMELLESLLDLYEERNPAPKSKKGQDG